MNIHITQIEHDHLVSGIMLRGHRNFGRSLVTSMSQNKILLLDTPDNAWAMDELRQYRGALDAGT